MPCLLVQNDRLVKTVKFRNPTYVGDPVNAIKIYNEKEVDELILLDITATQQSRDPNFELVETVANECFMPLCYGGGVREVEHARRLFGIGVEKVAINSHAAEHEEIVGACAGEFGNQSIVLSIDVKKSWRGKRQVLIGGGRKKTSHDPVDYARRMENAGAGEILLTSIDRDGTWEGYDIDLIREVSGAVTIPVIACGGAGSVSDFGEAVSRGGASAVAAGSMVVYSGKDLGVLIKFPSREELECALK